LFNRCGGLVFKEEVLADDMPPEVLHKMSQIPYCIQSSDPNGMETDQFNSHPATVATAEMFSKASSGLEEYVAQRMAVVKGARVGLPAGR
jgi:hypothetical protein